MAEIETLYDLDVDEKKACLRAMDGVLWNLHVIKPLDNEVTTAPCQILGIASDTYDCDVHVTSFLFSRLNFSRSEWEGFLPQQSTRNRVQTTSIVKVSSLVGSSCKPHIGHRSQEILASLLGIDPTEAPAINASDKNGGKITCYIMLHAMSQECGQPCHTIWRMLSLRLCHISLSHVFGNFNSILCAVSIPN